MTESKKICPRCFGNGYIRIPNESVSIPKQPNFDYSGVDANKLQ